LKASIKPGDTMGYSRKDVIRKIANQRTERC
jgi:hypothetical protein